MHLSAARPVPFDASRFGTRCHHTVRQMPARLLVRDCFDTNLVNRTFGRDLRAVAQAVNRVADYTVNSLVGTGVGPDSWQIKRGIVGPFKDGMVEGASVGLKHGLRALATIWGIAASLTIGLAQHGRRNPEEQTTEHWVYWAKGITDDWAASLARHTSHCLTMGEETGKAITALMQGVAVGLALAVAVVPAAVHACLAGLASIRTLQACAPSLRVSQAIEAARTLRNQRQYDAACRVLESGRRDAVKARDRAELALWTGKVNQFRGEVSQAHRNLEEARLWADQISNSDAQALTLAYIIFQQGMCHRAEGNDEAMRSSFTEATPLLQRVRDCGLHSPRTVAGMRHKLAFIRQHAGDVHGAAREYDTLATIRAKLGDTTGAAYALAGRAQCDYQNGLLDTAIVNLEQGLIYVEAHGSRDVAAEYQAMLDTWRKLVAPA